jgi:alkanesulfonate monooxygenase SsuD/methylene tetrahydromethanopterin reductase-like flavin-dependent oxidoreductase (luciferase family)
MMFALLQRGQLVRVPPVDRALEFLAAERTSLAEHPSLPTLPPRTRRTVVGAPATVRAGIEAVAREYGADEVMVVTITHDHAVRRRSYELIARAFAMPAAMAGAPGRAA